MFNSITAPISGHDFPMLYLQDGAVEWELEVSAATFQSAIAGGSGEAHRVFIHVYTREDLIRLYGFWTDAERVAFRELLRVPGIGPRQALRILSGTSVEALSQLLEQEDVTALTRIPGLGRKTAQKMVLQLKGSLVTDRTDRRAGGGADPSGDELEAALTEMGFDRGQARRILDDLRTGDDAVADEQELFRRAIVALSGPA